MVILLLVQRPCTCPSGVTGHCAHSACFQHFADTDKLQWRNVQMCFLFGTSSLRDMPRGFHEVKSASMGFPSTWCNACTWHDMAVLMPQPTRNEEAHGPAAHGRCEVYNSPGGRRVNTQPSHDVLPADAERVCDSGTTLWNSGTEGKEREWQGKSNIA
jgi:hypothetical protein